MSPHRIDYSSDGARARITLDLEAGYDGDLEAMLANVTTVTNFLPAAERSLRKSGGALNIADAATSVVTPVAMFAWIHAGAVTYYSWDSYLTTSAFKSGGAATTIAETPLPTDANDGSNRGTMIGSLGLAGGKAVRVFGGKTHARLSGSTAVFTTGSTTVTGLSGMTASHIDSFLTNTQDSSTTIYAYRIVSVPSATSVVIDKVYAGSRSGVASTWRCAAQDVFRVTPGVFSPQIASASPLPSGYTTADREALLAANVVATAWNRLVVGNTIEGTSSKRYENRLRWSGDPNAIITDGTAPYTGLNHFNAAGYLDLPSQHGAILAILPRRDTVFVFQEYALTILRGTPTTDGFGTLTQSTYPNMSVRASPSGDDVAACHADRGVVWCDVRGDVRLVRDDGGTEDLSGFAQRATIRLTAPTRAATHGDYLYLFATGATILLCHMPSRRWTTILVTTSSPVGPQASVPTSQLNDLVALVGGKLTSLSSIVDYPGAVGAARASCEWKTGYVGDPGMMLRPARVLVTYNYSMSDATVRYVTLVVTTGLAATPAGEHTYTTTTQLPATTDVETHVVELPAIARDATMRVRIEDGGADRLDIYRVVVECDVEGQGPSVG